ncbi:pentraxin fusion protein-like [Pelodytes ibericus]
MILSERNVALAHPVCQSSVMADGGPRRAVDGRKDADYSAGSCTHTDNDFPAWWRVDLKESHKINTVVVMNRGDCCRERLEGAEVWIGNSEEYSKNTLCDTILDVFLPSVSICCKRMEGRYVAIVIPGRREYLTLCEVEVYGAPVQDTTECE